MKRGFYIILSVLAIIVGMSCSKTKSYTDMLNDQQKVIDRFMDENDFRILSEYPKNGVFKSNEFVDLNGIYMNVIDSGRGDKIQYGEVVYCRYKGNYLMGDTTLINLFTTGSIPTFFRYGYINMYDDDFLSAGVEAPLSILRDSAEVKLIVPFQYGASYGQKNGYPVYFERVKYLLKK